MLYHHVLWCPGGKFVCAQSCPHCSRWWSLSSCSTPKKQPQGNEPHGGLFFFTSQAIAAWQPSLRKPPLMWLTWAVFVDCPLMPSACEAVETPCNCCSSRWCDYRGGSPCMYTRVHTALCWLGLEHRLKLSTHQSDSCSYWFPVGPWWGEGGWGCCELSQQLGNWIW